MRSDNPWYKLLQDDGFWRSVEERGYYHHQSSFPSYVKKYNLQLSRDTPYYLSIDFWSEQSKTLTDKKLYVIRTGTGSFAIFDEKRFPKPYLQLETSNAREMQISEVAGYKHLKKAYADHHQEDPNLERLYLTDIYEQLVEKTCGTSKFFRGPRGNRYSEFRLYFRDTKGDVSRFNYKGQEDLDYSLWTEESVLVIETKQNQPHGGLDIGWHKLAYPAQRFRYENLNVIPVYYLRVKDVIFLFVFNKMKFEEGGIVLNDYTQFVPSMTFRIDLDPESRLTHFV
ncbi:MAG TPA: hypothetical protein VGA94_01795 [Thermodesulfobacteriota bacterium]